MTDDKIREGYFEVHKREMREGDLQAFKRFILCTGRELSEFSSYSEANKEILKYMNFVSSMLNEVTSTEEAREVLDVAYPYIQRK